MPMQDTNISYVYFSASKRYIIFNYWIGEVMLINVADGLPFFFNFTV